jgi:hypothetical protein
LLNKRLVGHIFCWRCTFSHFNFLKQLLSLCCRYNNNNNSNNTETGQLRECRSPEENIDCYTKAKMFQRGETPQHPLSHPFNNLHNTTKKKNESAQFNLWNIKFGFWFECYYILTDCFIRGALSCSAFLLAIQTKR